MPNITGNEPFYPQKELDVDINSPHINIYRGITIRQEAILRFMVELKKYWSPGYEDECAEQAEKFADAYIKILNSTK